MKKQIAFFMAAILSLTSTVQIAASENEPFRMEYLDRGTVAVKSGKNVYLSWRLLGTEVYDTTFDIYRDGEKIAEVSNTNYTDNVAGAEYIVVPSGESLDTGKAVEVWSNQYLTIPLDRPAGETGADGVEYTYSPNDVTPADVDGDGEYELILKWEPSNSFDSGKSANYNGNVYIDCYKLNGTKLWRIDMGININAGAHFTQMAAYDFDLDGKAELAMKTAPGTKDGQGKYVSQAALSEDIKSTDDLADYRHSEGGIADTSGRVLSGPEFYTVFQGDTGAALDTIYYPHPRGTVSEWGDNWGNRSERYLAAVAYLDGQTPSMIAWRGYYAKTTATAYNLVDKRLVMLADFDTSLGYWDYGGQGNHNLTVGDVDGDGCDEILCGSLALDNDLTPLWCSGRGHGDALHLGDYDPINEGMEYFSVHEDFGGSIITGSTTGHNGELHLGGMTLYAAKDGEELFHVDSNSDQARGMMANVGYSDGYFELWGSGNYASYGGSDVRGGSYYPASANQRIFWDGDMYDELLDGYSSRNCPIVINGTGMNESYFNNVITNNDTKNNPCLIADLFGDWREEFVARSRNNESLIVYTTKIPTENKLYTLMHDRTYRMQAACQNSGYNQPPHIGYYVDNENSEYDMRKKQPNIFTVQIEVTPLPTNTPKPTENVTAAPTDTPTPTAAPPTAEPSPTPEPIELKNGQKLFAVPQEGDVYRANESGSVKIIVSGTCPTPTPSPEVRIENWEESSYKIVSIKPISHAKLILLADVWTEEFTGAKIYDVSTDAENEAFVDVSDCDFENYDMVLWESLENMKPLCKLVPYFKGGTLTSPVRVQVTNADTHRSAHLYSTGGGDGLFTDEFSLPPGSYSISVRIDGTSYNCKFKVE